MGKGCSASSPLPAHQAPQISTCSSTWSPSSGCLIEASLYSHDLLNHWPLEIILNPQFLSPTQRCVRRGGKWKTTESFNPLIIRLIPLTTNPAAPSSGYLGLFQKLSHQHNRPLYCSHHLGNYNGFRCSVPDVHFYYKSQYHTYIYEYMWIFRAMNTSGIKHNTTSTHTEFSTQIHDKTLPGT